jgi:Zn-dependent M16 (insulinase) family peptidase
MTKISLICHFALILTHPTVWRISWSISFYVVRANSLFVILSPVRDPFFSMSRRSLNTFMNALTGPDFTCYPASSQVPKDFYNLLEVYLDAVFYPVLSKLSFLQEGHRLEFLKPNDPNSPLIFKGIVFNEMKGAMASPDARLSEAVMQALFPDLTYSVNSGGEPQQILDLTLEELKAFHEKFYHPSRCLFYFYSNLPIEQHLDFLQKHVFDHVQRVPPLPVLPLQPRFNVTYSRNSKISR